MWPVIVGILLAAGCGKAAREPRIHASIPEEITSGERYLFYLHGRIIEDQGVRPTHPRFGVYEYEQILHVLADSGFCVISEARSPGTSVERYADKLVSQIRMLLERGVDGRHISVVGFSKGALIALRVSTLLRDERVSFVILAGCSQQVLERIDVSLTGRVLSLFDANDNVAGSCDCLFEKGKPGLVPYERVLHVESRPGFGHGVFYRPRDTWLSPVVQWIRGDG
jgi:hypothetical protein